MNKKSVKTGSPEFTILDPKPMEPFILQESGNEIVLGVYPASDAAISPEYKTQGAGCFDLSADLSANQDQLTVYEPTMNREVKRRVHIDALGRYVLLEPGERILIPTGLIFEIPVGFCINIFIRSSVGLKKGLSLANGVGYIDSDYREETLIPLINMSRTQVRINDKERLAQAELRPCVRIPLELLDERPQRVGNRTGGFGSTNKK